MTLRDQIQREIAGREPLLVATVVGDRRLVQFDGTGPDAGIVFVVDLEIGSNRPMLNVPVKAAGDGGRFYALAGATVLCRRNLRGRWQVVAPGDRNVGQMVTKRYDLTTQSQVGGDDLRGTLRVRDPFEFYAGTQALKGNPALTFTAGANDEIFRAAGSWIDDGFQPATSVRIGRLSVNAGLRTVLTVSDSVLQLVGPGFVDEGPLQGVSVGTTATSRWNDGVLGFPSVRIVDGTGNTITPT